MSQTATNIPILDGSNYNNWKFRILAILRRDQCADVIENECPTEGTERSSFLVRDAKAQSLIIQGVSDKHLDIIKDCTSAKQQLECLKNVFVRSSSFTKLTLWRKLFNLKSGNNERLEDHFVKFDTIIRDLQDLGSKVDETDRVCHLLLSLPSQYDTVVTAIETIADVKMDFVKARLLDEEIKIRSRSDSDSAKVNSEVSFKAFLPSSGCFICGDKSHFKAQCPKRFGRGRGRGRRGRGGFTRPHTENTGRAIQANLAKDDGIVLFAANVCNNKITLSDNSFVIDSGASNHFVKEELLPYMDEIVRLDHKVNICIANGNILTSSLRGKLKASCQGREIKLEALVVPKLKHNLLSVSKMTSKGLKVIIQDNHATICTQKFALICEKVNGVYVLKVDEYRSEKCNITVEEGDLWHRRMGHLEKDALTQLGLPIPNKVCTTCVESKATRLPFSASGRQSKKIGDLIHSDVCGPITPETINGERYFQVIMDDFSHFVVVKLMKYKNEAEANLIHYIQEMKTQFGIKPKRLRVDNGGEFSSKNFTKFAEKNGILIEYTISHSPQMNGKSERLNRTLLNKVRCKITDSGIPKSLWGEALRCSAYELNRSPTSALERGNTPSRLWHGRNDISKMKIFGCRAWHTVMPKANKLNPRAIRGVMVGYCGGGYRLWLPTEEKIIRSRDVRFDESVMEYSGKETENQYTFNNEYVPITPEESKVNKTDKDDEELDPDDITGESNEEDDEIVTRKSVRNTKLPARLQDCELYTAYCFLASSSDEPASYEEAVKSDEWSEAIRLELESHKTIGTWTPVSLPDGEKAIDTQWIFKVKEDGTKKARLVAKGYQVPQDNFEFSYAPVCRIPTVRLLLSMAVQKDWKLRQIDVPTAFLNGKLDNDVYIKVPEGLKTTATVLKLKRALYGLRNAPKCWNDKFNQVMSDLHFRRSQYDFCLYCGDNVYLVLFVDDAIIAGADKKVDELLEKLHREFKIKNLGEPSSFIGMEITRSENGLYLSQPKMIDRLLKNFNMENCRSVATPMEVNFQLDEAPIIDNVFYRKLICSLMYLSVTTRPDLSFSVSYLSRYLDKPTNLAWKAGKRILRYLRCTKNLGLHFTKRATSLEGMCDSDWGADKKTRKSVSGFISFYAGNPIAWHSKKQNCVALSSMEAEYISAGSAAQELVNLRGVLSELVQTSELDNVVLKVDNASAISMMHTYENSKRGKHIDIKYHFIKDLCRNNVIKIVYVSSNDNVSDLFTKPLGKEKFVKFRSCVLKEIT